MELMNLYERVVELAAPEVGEGLSRVRRRYMQAEVGLLLLVPTCDSGIGRLWWWKEF